MNGAKVAPARSSWRNVGCNCKSRVSTLTHEVRKARSALSCLWNCSRNNSEAPEQHRLAAEHAVRNLYWVLGLTFFGAALRRAPDGARESRHRHHCRVDRADLDCDQLRTRPFSLRRSSLGGRIPVLLLSLSFPAERSIFTVDRAFIILLVIEMLVLSRQAYRGAPDARHTYQRISLGSLSAASVFFPLRVTPPPEVLAFYRLLVDGMLMPALLGLYAMRYFPLLHRSSEAARQVHASSGSASSSPGSLN